MCRRLSLSPMGTVSLAADGRTDGRANRRTDDRRANRSTTESMSVDGVRWHGCKRITCVFYYLPKVQFGISLSLSLRLYINSLSNEKLIYEKLTLLTMSTATSLLKFSGVCSLTIHQSDRRVSISDSAIRITEKEGRKDRLTE